MDKINEVNAQKIEVSKKIEAARHISVIYLDFPYISRTTLGRHWKRTNYEKREEFMSAFSDYLLVSIVPQLGDYLKKGLFQIEKK